MHSSTTFFDSVLYTVTTLRGGAVKQVYVELILLDNFLMDFLILYFTARFSDKRARIGRLSLGAAIGAVYSAFAVAVPILGHIVCKLLCSAAMCLPLGERIDRLFLKRMAFLYAVTFIFGGSIYFLSYWFGGDISSGCINLPILRYILLGAVISSLIIETLLRVQHPSADTYYKLMGTVGGEKFILTAFLDTGNRLSDAGGGGVVIAHKKTVLSQLSPALREKVLSARLADVPVRQFYFSTVSGRGEMYAFLPETLTLSDGKKLYAAKAYIALSDARFSAHSDAVLGPNIRLLYLNKEAPLEQATSNSIDEDIAHPVCPSKGLLHKRQRSAAAPSFQK